MSSTIRPELQLSDNTSCVVLGGSSLTTLSKSGEVEKSPFYPKTVEEYFSGIVDAALANGLLNKGQKGILLIAAPGAFQNEGAIAGLPPNFHKVKEDALQRGMPNLYFRQLMEQELASRGYNQVEAYGYNDAVPALLATLCQENTEEVLKAFEGSLGSNDRSKYAIKYMINGTGTGEAALYPDTRNIVTAEKGHLKPNLLWYRLNPFFQYISKYSIVGENRSIERLIAGGPTQKSPRHFSKVLKAIINTLKESIHADHEDLAQLLSFKSYQELLSADKVSGLLLEDLNKEDISILQVLGSHVQRDNKLAIAFQNIFAKAIGTSMAYMHYVLGEMPDTPLHTFIGANEIRLSALGFIRTDGSTTALLGQDGEAWDKLNKAAQSYAHAILNLHNEMSSRERPTPIFQILNINEVFPNIDPDFGGLPALAEAKLNK